MLSTIFSELKLYKKNLLSSTTSFDNSPKFYDHSTQFITSNHPDSKVKRTRSNLSWLRKSMRKLNPFQMPQINSENQPQSAPIASTSETSHCVDCRTGKNVLNEQNSIHEVQTRNDDIITSSCSSNPDLFNIVLTEQQQNTDHSRPRQYGRRSNPVRISSFQIDSNDSSAVR